jgi:CDP-paratose 2-epimerase
MRFLITGGAGFIGSNAAARLRSAGHDVTVLDNLSRAAAALNLEWLRRTDSQIRFVHGDVRDEALLARLMGDPWDAILHLAGQVAVTTSIVDPVHDWDQNAVGTFRLLEAIRRAARDAPDRAPLLIYASTNKVYGHLTSGEALREGRWELSDLPQGVTEEEPLSFESPYGCSKGAADQYVLDYHRSFGLPTTAFRQSCIYGTRQFGEEDQGWVAWFALASAFQLPLTIYGDGCQVRDLLWVDDLVDAYLAAAQRRDVVAGRAYNIGGGPAFRLSLGQLVDELSRRRGKPLEIQRGPVRLGDQRAFYCDTSRARRDLQWTPRVAPEEGVSRLTAWIEANRAEIGDFLRSKGIPAAD